jgi:hypothetical protein
MDFFQLLKDLNDGEQNRYGEIEYKFSDNERMKIIENLSNHLKKGDLLTSEENERLTSCIYWGLFGTLGMVECYLINFIPLLSIPSVRKAFQDRFSTELVLYSRVQYAEHTLRNISELGLESRDWKKLAMVEIQKWPVEDQESSDTILFLEKLRRTK